VSMKDRTRKHRSEHGSAQKVTLRKKQRGETARNGPLPPNFLVSRLTNLLGLSVNYKPRAAKGSVSDVSCRNSERADAPHRLLW
jgi:hypothetical protein